MPKKKPSKPLKIKIGIITDIHYGFNIRAKLGAKAPKLMQAFEKAVALYKPDFIVDMADRISGKDPVSDRENMVALKAHFNRMAAPTHHLHGNHDLRYLSRAENEEITGSPGHSWSKDQGGFHFIFWNPEIKYDPKGLHVSDSDLLWLKNDLASTDRPTIVFSHIPIDHEDKPQPNPHEKIAVRFHYADSQNIREILENSGHVKLCMSGHVHRNHHSQINNIHYISQQSLTQMHQKHYRVPARAWSWLEIDDDHITVKLQGRVRKDYLIPLAA